MGVFDALIDKDGNKEPDNIEYIYDLDCIWPIDEIDGTRMWEGINVKRGLIVNNVTKLDNGGYSFNIKGKDGLYTCNYGWAFLENTEDNLERIKDYQEFVKEYEKTLSKKNELYNKIKKLKN